ncbi:MAG: flagellar basal-body rod protein FlgG [Alphaproteobacteria bacterium]
MRAMAIGATGMLAQQMNVEVISNNIANITTVGFKRQRAEFKDLLYENVRRPGSQSSDTGTVVPTGIQIGNGVATGSVYRINLQGSIEQTGNSLDLAVSGKGFLQIQLPDGTTAYTRAGSLQLNSTGQIVTSDGYQIVPNITVPADTIDITVNSSGQVFAKIDGQVSLSNLGQIQLANFANPAGLEAIGDNLLRETPASGTATTGNPLAAGFGKLLQGSLEKSNVDIVQELTNLITAQRAYEMNSRVIKSADDMLSALNQLR